MAGLNEQLDELQAARDAMKTAFVAYGKEANTDIRTYANEITKLTDDATVLEEGMLEGATAYARGKKITGKIKSYGGLGRQADRKEYSAGADGQLYLWLDFDTPSAFQVNAGASIKNSELAELVKLTPDKLKSGVEVLGVTGEYAADFSETLTPEAYNAAITTAANILGEEQGGTN